MNGEVGVRTTEIGHSEFLRSPDLAYFNLDFGIAVSLPSGNPDRLSTRPAIAGQINSSALGKGYEENTITWRRFAVGAHGLRSCSGAGGWRVG